MKQILPILEEKGETLTELRALEMFGRDGSWQTAVFAPRVKSIDIWEVDPIFEADLRQNIPYATIKITDSIKELQNPAHAGQYDFVVADNPQNCYGEAREYAEHFDLFPEVLQLLGQTGIFIFNLNKQPFNADAFTDWAARRKAFYQTDEAMSLTIPWALQFYTSLFEREGFTVDYSFSQSRQDLEHNDYLHYLVFKLRRNIAA